MAVLLEAPVLERCTEAPGIERLTLLAPHIAREARPGQFIHLRVGPALDPLLRRPLAVHSADADNGAVSVLFQIVGRGTRMLSSLVKGSLVSILGPLGRGFSCSPVHSPVAVIAGGLGIAPLTFLIHVLSSLGVTGTLFQGARTKTLLVDLGALPPGFERQCGTDDGSLGFAGSVVDLFSRTMERRKDYRYVYAAGPYPMLRSLAASIEGFGLGGEVSLEQRMACGVGACLCCNIALNNHATVYGRVCADGPVFKVDEVAWR